MCNLAVTNVCNARCDFCNYASDKHLVAKGLFADYDRYCKTLDLLSRNGVRFLSMVGGEPTLHPQLLAMVGYAAQSGIRPSIVTNGSRLWPRFVRDLAQSGLKSLFISIDSASRELHEKNRGLPGVCERIREAVGECKRRNIQVVASVTINKLLGSIPALFTFLCELGIETVDFSYPKRMLHSSALSFSETSPLIDFSAGELGENLETIRSFKSRYKILNSRESIAEVLRFLRKEEQLYPC
ncbi:MAG: radical SAM protein, partial [Syntrophobacteraceae bacterium]